MNKLRNIDMKSRRGVSPLVATVLLVALVIIIAIIIWLWYGKFIEDIQNKQQIDLELACAQDVQFVLSDIQCTGGVISFYAENTGNIDLRGFKISYSGEINGAEDREIIIEQGTGSTVSSEDVGASPGLDLEIVPIIGIGSQNKVCDALLQAASC
jgi:flagellin-like protein